MYFFILLIPINTEIRETDNFAVLSSFFPELYVGIPLLSVCPCCPQAGIDFLVD